MSAIFISRRKFVMLATSLEAGIVDRMDDSLAFERQFNQIVTSVEKDSGAEQRIQDASVDRKLVIAVYDEISAQIELTFPFGGEETEVYEKRYDEAHKKVIEVAVHLQHEYGLDDEDILKAVKLARLDIQNNKIIFD